LLGINLDFQATVNGEGASAEHKKKDEGVDDRREERRKEQLLGHEYVKT
jgi:predicted RNase H-like nuclease